MSKFLHVLKCVLYELQPIRAQDVLSFVEGTVRICRELYLEFIDLCSGSKQALVGLPKLLQDADWNYLSRYLICIVIWFGIWRAFVYVEFGSLWLLISMYAAIFLNLGERKEGELSAYSVFNTGYKRLLGTLDAEQFDNEIRHRPLVDELAVENADNFVGIDDIVFGAANGANGRRLR